MLVTPARHQARNFALLLLKLLNLDTAATLGLVANSLPQTWLSAVRVIRVMWISFTFPPSHLAVTKKVAPLHRHFSFFSGTASYHIDVDVSKYFEIRHSKVRKTDQCKFLRSSTSCSGSDVRFHKAHTAPKVEKIFYHYHWKSLSESLSSIMSSCESCDISLAWAISLRWASTSTSMRPRNPWQGPRRWTTRRSTSATTMSLRKPYVRWQQLHRATRLQLSFPPALPLLQCSPQVRTRRLPRLDLSRSGHEDKKWNQKNRVWVDSSQMTIPND